MKIHWHPFVDWEPLIVRIMPRGSVPSLRDRVEALLTEVLALRTTERICGCCVKSADVEKVARSTAVEIACEWMCNKCLEVLFKRVESAIPEVERIEIGLALMDDLHGEFPNLDRSAYVEVLAKTVEFEDGSKVAVEPFTISRWPVSVGEYERFVEATGYVTLAEREGQDTFRNDPASEGLSERVRKRKPAAWLSYLDAMEYCNWAGVRLPTEAEWLASALVDQTIFDRRTDRDQYEDEEGRLRAASHPDALEYLGEEWVLSEQDSDTAVIRFGPQWVRFTDWRKHPKRMVWQKTDYDLMVGFRVVRHH